MARMPPVESDLHRVAVAMRGALRSLGMVPTGKALPEGPREAEHWVEGDALGPDGVAYVQTGARPRVRLAWAVNIERA